MEDSGVISRVAVGMSENDTQEQTGAPKPRATDVADDDAHELLKASTTVKSPSKVVLQPAASESTAEHADPTISRQNPRMSPLTKPDTLRTQPKQGRHITIPHLRLLLLTVHQRPHTATERLHVL
jgi:hypothetical protein